MAKCNQLTSLPFRGLTALVNRVYMKFYYWIVLGAINATLRSIEMTQFTVCALCASYVRRVVAKSVVQTK